MPATTHSRGSGLAPLARGRALLATGAGLALAAGLAACGGNAPAPAVAPPAVSEPVSLSTSIASPGATWATLVMGGSAAANDNFWQLFVRPAGEGTWRLVTPPGVADNGGLVMAAGGTVTVGFRPSIMLAFTPFTASSDNGQTWNSGNPIYGVLASVPGALAADPGSGRLLALLKNGVLRSGTLAGTNWTQVASLGQLAKTPAGRQCGLISLTGTGYTPSGVPLLAGACARPGQVGLLADQAGTWALTGPALPGALAGQPVRVLALGRYPGTRAASGTAGLAVVLEVGPPESASLVTIWSADNAVHWQASAPHRLPAGARPTAISFGPAGLVAVVLAGGASGAESGLAIAGAGTAWRALPKLPAGTETLAAGLDGSIQALAADRSLFTVWQAGPGGVWTRTQTMNIPIQYGSSG